MHRRYGLLMILTALVVGSASYDAYSAFHQSRLPFSFDIVDAHTAVVEPIPGTPLPPALHAGDRIDLSASPPLTRIGIIRAAQFVNRVPAGRTYDFAIRRGGAIVMIPVTSIATAETSSVAGMMRADEWGFLCLFVLLGGIALLTLWRGRDRSAAGLALWAITSLLGFTVVLMPLDDRVGFGIPLGAWSLFLLERVGFYIMVESIVGGALTARARALWRITFLLLLGAAAVVALGGPLIFIAAGSALLLRSPYGFAMTASYLPPIALLLAGYRRADSVLRLRLRWMLWSSALFVTGILLSNSQILGYLASLLGADIMPAIAMAGFLYAILRNRIVDFTVVLNHALVYAATTSFVLGLFALFESLIERTALGHGASLLLELAVPLALGVSLSTVHRRIDSTVERFVFRRQYREEVALRGFAKECAFVTQPESLLDLTVDQIRLHVGTPWVALYEQALQGYVRVRQRGSQELPAQVATDDLTLVKLRTHDTEVDLHDTPSTLGRDGYAFPMRVRGSLLGVLLIGPRPGEHYVAEERELLAHVAHAVGAALFALRAQASEAELKETRAQAHASEALLNDVRAEAQARAQVSEAMLNEARAREETLLDTLRAFGATARP